MVNVHDSAPSGDGPGDEPEDEPIEGPLTAHDLLDVAHRQRYAVSATQLAAWSRAGVLPHSWQQGRGRGKGTTTWYPAGTARQLLALCALRRQAGRRLTLTELAWGLWWQGYPLPLDLIRRRLRSCIDDLAAMRDWLLDTTTGELSDDAWQLLDHAETARYTHPLLRQARKRVGSARFPTFLRVILQVISGTFVDLATFAGASSADEDEARLDQQIVDTGFGVTRGRTERMLGAPPWLVGGLDDPLRLLTNILDPATLAARLDQITDDDLAAVRSRLAPVIDLLMDMSYLAETLWGRGALGLTLLRAWSGTAAPLTSVPAPTSGRTLHATPPLHHAPTAAFLILLALPIAPSARLARDATDQRLVTMLDGFDTLATQALATWPTTMQNFATLTALGQAFPGLTDLLSSPALGKALRSDAALIQHQTQVAAYRTDHAAELDAFFRQLGQQMGAAAPETPEEATSRS